MDLRFIVFLLSVPALQGKNNWTIIYTSRDVCALSGSTVDISCTYEYPYGNLNFLTKVTTLWFTKVANDQPVDLKHDADYTDRVEYSCEEEDCAPLHCNGKCTLRVRDLRESDSADYKFRIITSKKEGKYTGHPGVNLTVTDLQVKVSVPSPTDPTFTILTCLSMCGVAGGPRYIWFRNGQDVGKEQSYRVNNTSEDHYSCAVKGHEHLRSHSVYSPKTPSVSVSPSGEVEEGSSVTLNCSSDANPAANYTWFRVNKGRTSRDMNQGQQHVFSPILTSDSGRYICEAKNVLGKKSVSISINVKYGPKHTSVFSSPSGVVEVGSSVTLSCSSDANPAANYTWFKEHGDSAGESGQNYTITNITSELGGKYYCQAHNAVGRHNSTFLFINVTATSSSSSSSSSLSWTAAVAVGTIGVVLAAILILVFLQMRTRRAIGPGGRPGIVEEPLPDPVYDNVSALTNRLAPAAQTEAIEQQYATINTSRAEYQERPGDLAGSPVQSDPTEEIQYSLVNFPRPNPVPEDPDRRKTGETSELYSNIQLLNQ